MTAEVCKHENFTDTRKCNDCCLEIVMESKAMRKDYYEQGLRKAMKLIDKGIEKMNREEA